MAAARPACTPASSPGGWQLIGHTRLKLFDPTAAQPTLLQPGDRVRFVCEELRHGEILRPGVQTSVQDRGRRGLRHLGIAQAGALDMPALYRANSLLGNDPDAAGLEITLGPVSVRFGRDAWLALSGAHFHPELNGRPIHTGQRVFAQAGHTLTLSGCQYGMRTYLAVDGGIDAPLTLGARHRSARRLWRRAWPRAGSRRPAAAGRARNARRPLAAAAGLDAYVRALPGPDYASFSPSAQAAFWQRQWTVTPSSNRMGMRLRGTPLVRRHNMDLLSHAVFPGVVQAPPDGQPIILLADAQTTGGYPCLATVIQADLEAGASLPAPGAHLYFVPCSAEDARAALVPGARRPAPAPRLWHADRVSRLFFGD